MSPTLTDHARTLAQKAATAHDSSEAMRFSQAATNITNAAATILMIERETPALPVVPDDRVKHMVSRFLQWKLPHDFSPDGGISFEQTYTGVGGAIFKREPVGTNLLTTAQAEEMIRHLLA